LIVRVLRSFIAIELPETVKSAFVELQGELKKTGADIRWVKPENIHLTLKFLGNTEESTDSIVDVIKGTCSRFEPVTLEIRGVGVFPNVKSPRVIWAGMNCNTALAEIRISIEEGLFSLGFERDSRKFSPHLTLGRFRSSQGRRPLMDKIELLKDKSYGMIHAETVVLMKSDLAPGGAQYTRLAEISLGKRSDKDC
jgi:2'-5' RNA ligase